MGKNDSVGSLAERLRKKYSANKWTFSRREMHDAVCSDCGKECKVPFKPQEGRPVYCKECYSKHKEDKR